MFDFTKEDLYTFVLGFLPFAGLVVADFLLSIETDQTINLVALVTGLTTALGRYLKSYTAPSA